MTQSLALLLFLLPLIQSLPDERERLDENRRLWENKEINSYLFDYSESCLCTLEFYSPLTVVVKDDSVVTFYTRKPLQELVREQTGGEVSDEEYQWFVELLWGDAPTIEGLFDFIADAIEQGAYFLQVKYEEEYGYPVQIDVDYSEDWYDEVISIYVKNLRFGL